MEVCRWWIFYDVHVELAIPADLPSTIGPDPARVVRLISALLTLKATPRVSVPILSNLPFSQVPESVVDPVLRPMDFGESPLIPDFNAPTVLDLESLDWVRDHWIAAGELASGDRKFDTALQGFYNATRAPRPSLALLSLWGILEEMFSPDRSELRFRVSALIATYLAPAGAERHAMQKTVAKLYDARSKAAHGTGADDWGALVDTYALIRAVLRKMIHHQHVPSKVELEASLFGG